MRTNRLLRKYNELSQQYRWASFAYNSSFPNPESVKQYQLEKLISIAGRLIPLAFKLQSKGIINL